MKVEEWTIDDIEDDEYLRRYFFSNFYDEDLGSWSTKAFKLRNQTPPENYISVNRCKISPDAIACAKAIFHSSKLKKLRGYALLRASDIRNISIQDITLKLLSINGDAFGHSGIFTWCSGKLVEGEGQVDNPFITELQNTLLKLATPTYQDFPEDTF